MQSGSWAVIALGASQGGGPMWRWQRWLSPVFVLGCRFRASMPRTDVQRIYPASPPIPS